MVGAVMYCVLSALVIMISIVSAFGAFIMYMFSRSCEDVIAMVFFGLLAVCAAVVGIMSVWYGVYLLTTAFLPSA